MTTKKKATKKKSGILKLKKFSLNATVVTFDGNIIGEYVNDEFRPNDHGDSLCFVWMQASQPRDMLTYLVRQLDAITNPPKKNFKRKVEAE